MPRWFFFIAGVALLGALGVFAVTRLSPRGIADLKFEEGFRLRPYKDKAGIWTIYHGHKILPGEVFNNTAEEGERILLQDLAIAESAVQRLVKVTLSAGQYDALVSMVFNIGVTAFANSTLLKKLNAADYQGAYHEMARWNKITVNDVKVEDKILTARRAREQARFLA